MFLLKKMNLKNLRISKIKQLPFGFLLDLGRKKLVITNKYMFLTEKNYAGISPTNFCEFLKSRLIGEKILEVNQVDFDRIVEIRTSNYFIVLEFFGSGNIILLDKERKILHGLELREWRDRKIKKGEIYAYPPSSHKNPFALTLKEISCMVDEKEIVRVLAKDFGFGGEIAQRICEKLSISPNSKSSFNGELLYDFFKNIEKNFPEFENVNEEIEKDYEIEYQVYKMKDIALAEEKRKRIREQQLKALESYHKKIEEMKENIKKIMENYLEYQEKFERSKSTSAKEVVIGGLVFDPRKSFNQNLQDFYEKIKEMKKKIERISQMTQNVEIKKEEKEKRKMEWYEKFRWFFSTDGFLVIGGKDAESNEIIIRKHARDGDIVFHADITGSPFVVIKNPQKKKIPETTIKEAAEFCACYSKAWKIGIQADVYYVLPEQVKKEAGLQKGSFMVYGKREWLRRLDMSLAIGVFDGRIIYGPVSAVKSRTKKYIVITFGEENVKEIFDRYFGELSEEARKVIPYGKCKVVEVHGV